MNFKSLLVGSLFSLMFSACGGGGGTDLGTNPLTNDTNNDTMNGVYTGGSSSPFVGANAILWKDGEITDLSITEEAISTAVFVTDSQVYLAGVYKDIMGDDRPCYWKGTVKTELDVAGSDEGFATSIYVDGNDVYVAGYYDDSGTIKACYWKNGTLTDLGEGEALSIIVDDGDLYVAGYDDANKPVYWKNGAKTVLSANMGIAYDIKVSNGDVYVAGTELDGVDLYAVYWENGVVEVLSSAGSDAVATSIKLSGGDVYVAGLNNDFQELVYWKNTMISKTELYTDIYFPTSPSAVCSASWCMPKIDVKDSDIYVIAPLSDGSDVVKGGYWKNGDFDTWSEILTNIFIK